MGYLQALEMKDQLELDQILQWHLQFNHYPPVHSIFVETAKETIDLANQGDWEIDVTLPNGRILTVSEIVEQLHLETFLDGKE
jgi:hypothetical protein